MFITLIRRTFLTLAVGVILATSVSGRAEAYPCSTAPAGGLIPSTYPFTTFPIEARSTDPVGPFPLAAMIPFPWASIQGIWTMRLPNRTSLHFSFEVQSDCAGRKFVQVLGFDQKTYRVTAEGVGLGLANDMIVRAAMSAAGSQYMLYIRQFKMPAGKSSGKISTVVTIRPFDSEGPNNDVHVIAKKASNLTLAAYVQQQLEQKRELEKRQADGRRSSVPVRP